MDMLFLKKCIRMTAEIDYKLVFKMVALSIIVGGLVYFMINTPTYLRVDEGFYGGVVRGSGQPDCLRTLPEASQLLDTLQQHRVATVGDYDELVLLLSKMACLKKDLMSPGAQVDATRYQAFDTSHDRIAVGELCGLCLSHNIPIRDLDISFSTWRTRGKELIRLLSANGSMKEQDTITAEMLFKKAFDDVYNIAVSRCIKTDIGIQHTALGDVGAFEPPQMQELRHYDYTYGGLSASGWNGAV